jgi:hypothetical protein
MGVRLIWSCLPLPTRISRVALSQDKFTVTVSPYPFSYLGEVFIALGDVGNIPLGLADNVLTSVMVLYIPKPFEEDAIKLSVAILTSLYKEDNPELYIKFGKDNDLRPVTPWLFG